MKIFLDTNAFYKNWFLNKANFKLLFHFVNNEWKEIVISKLVCQEVDNIRERELNQLIQSIENNLDKANKLNVSPLIFNKDTLGVVPYDFFSLLSNKASNVSVIDYESIPHSIVVDRALKNTKPFADGEKGYRDTLIWLSFLQYLKVNDIRGEVAFITNNKSDFYIINKKKVSFHPDLQKDIEEYGIRAEIKPYLTVFDFNSDCIDESEHLIDNDAFVSAADDNLECECETYLDLLDNNGLDELFGTQLFSKKITSLSYINARIFEGVEDSDIKQVKRLNDNLVYVIYEFNMRRVNFDITLDLVEYNQYSSEITSLYEYVDTEIDSENSEATVNFLIRPCFKTSLVFNTESHDVDEFDVQDISMYWKHKR
ncbi:hypothetical protein A6D98_02980 [Aliivibrio fischeri]|uniref:PIN domain-containing protein n=1 Tax=Aliivibrio fischeri TaxID=668 RepID=UPI00080E238D|nr:PIN domain-containing protein [Aliivibrio fischeri]OCH57046.1 hypothetical protein A6D98_02980 [Aliivibrio fischeri]